MQEYKTCEEVLEALKEGKKIVQKHATHQRRLCQKDGAIGCSNSKWHRIKYYYCNGQMNRTFAMLENGTTVDTSIDVLDFLYGGFIEYIEENEIPKKMTLKEIEKELGYRIELI